MSVEYNCQTGKLTPHVIDSIDRSSILGKVRGYLARWFRWANFCTDDHLLAPVFTSVFAGQKIGDKICKVGALKRHDTGLQNPMYQGHCGPLTIATMGRLVEGIAEGNSVAQTVKNIREGGEAALLTPSVNESICAAIDTPESDMHKAQRAILLNLPTPMETRVDALASASQAEKNVTSMASPSQSAEGNSSTAACLFSEQACTISAPHGAEKARSKGLGARLHRGLKRLTRRKVIAPSG
jgi:hypothetical protein